MFIGIIFFASYSFTTFCNTAVKVKVNNNKTAQIGNGVECAISKSKFIKLVIPNFINLSNDFHRVTKIAERAFLRCHIESVYLPESVEIICDFAFSECNILKIIDISRCKVTVIPPYMAFGCSNLKEIVFPQLIKRIEKYALAESSITKITLNTIKFIDPMAFFNCTFLNEVTILNKSKVVFKNSSFLSANGKVIIFVMNKFEGKYIVPTTVRSIGPYSFCDNHLSEIIIGKNVNKICDFAFYRTKNLRRITINSKCLKEIGRFAFSLSKIEEIFLPSSIVNINNSAFSYCPIKTINLSMINLKIINNLTFYKCFNLTKVDLPFHLQRIGSNAFSFTSINNIEIPFSLESIDEEAFSYCNFHIIDMHSTNITRLNKYVFMKCTKLLVVILPVKLTYLHETCFDSDFEVALVVYCGKHKFTGHKFISSPNVIVSAFYPIQYFADQKVIKRYSCPYPLPPIEEIIRCHRNNEPLSRFESIEERQLKNLIETSNESNYYFTKKFKALLDDDITNFKIPAISFFGGVLLGIGFIYAVIFL